MILESGRLDLRELSGSGCPAYPEGESAIARVD